MEQPDDDVIWGSFLPENLGGARSRNQPITERPSADPGLAVGADNRRNRAIERMIGTIIGAVGATLAALLPAPFPLVVAGLSVFLCVAYVRVGNYTLFVSFLTPAILLTIPSKLSALEAGIDRVEAVLGAVFIALMCSVAGRIFSWFRPIVRVPTD